MSNDDTRGRRGTGPNRENGERPRNNFRRDENRGGFRGNDRGNDAGSRNNFRRDESRPTNASGWQPFRSPASGAGDRSRSDSFHQGGRERTGEQDRLNEGRAPGGWQDRPQRGAPNSGERPTYRQGRGGYRSYEQDQRGRDRRPGGDRPFSQDRRPGGDRPFSPDRDRAPFQDRQADGDRPTFRDRDADGDRPSFSDRRPSGDRPFSGERPAGDRPSYGDRRPGSDRPSFGDRPSYGDRRPGGDRPSFQDRRPGGDRPFPANPRFGADRPSYGDRRPGGDRPYGDRRPGRERPFNRGEGQQEQSPFEGQGRPLGTTTRAGRSPVNQFERVQADVYGRWPVLESLRAGNVVKIYLAAGVKDSADHLQEIQTLAAEKHVTIVRVDRFALDNVLGNANHQGIAAATRPFSYASLDDVMAGAQKGETQPLLVLFDSVQDPQNLGSILRTAEAIGAQGAVLPKHNQAGITPAVIRASAGAVEHVPVAEVANLRQAIGRLKESGYWIVGLDMEGGTDYDNFDVNSPIALVVGGEGRGIGRMIAEECDYLVRLPMHGRVGSLNASVAAGIVLYEIDRRRTTASGKTRPAVRAAETELERTVQEERQIPEPATDVVARAAGPLHLDATDDLDGELTFAEGSGALGQRFEDELDETDEEQILEDVQDLQDLEQDPVEDDEDDEDIEDLERDLDDGDSEDDEIEEDEGLPVPSELAEGDAQHV